jgi:DUF917 family protein
LARVLNPEILSLLKNKTGKAEKTIRNEISLLRRTVSGTPINSVAQIYAIQHGTSVIMKLTPEERKAVPNLNIEKYITVKQKQHNTHKKKTLKQFIKYDTSDIFLGGHVEEVNRCYGGNRCSRNSRNVMGSKNQSKFCEIDGLF